MRLFVLAFIFPFAAQATDCNYHLSPLGALKYSTQALVAGLGPEQCDTSLRYGFPAALVGLSPFWAQDEVGADLAKEELRRLEEKGVNIKTPVIADADGGLNGQSYANGSLPHPSNGSTTETSHAIEVTNILGGDGPFGVGYRNVVSISDYEHSDLREVLKDMSQDKNVAMVNLEVHTLTIANSQLFGDLDPNSNASMIHSAVAPLAEKKIVVAAAGNYHATHQDFLNSSPDLRNVIVVGSTNEYGLVSEFSEASPDITILAPADTHQASSVGVPTIFGGTSGATPIVSGALSNVLNLIEPLNPTEAKMLVVNTATPLPIAAVDHRHGAGLVNAYKMVRVAERLREQGWPKNSTELLRERKL